MSEKAMESFIEDNRARFSPETVRSYRISISQFFNFCNKDFQDVKATDVRAWLGIRLVEIMVRIS